MQQLFREKSPIANKTERGGVGCWKNGGVSAGALKTERLAASGNSPKRQMSLSVSAFAADAEFRVCLRHGMFFRDFFREGNGPEGGEWAFFHLKRSLPKN